MVRVIVAATLVALCCFLPITSHAGSACWTDQAGGLWYFDLTPTGPYHFAVTGSYIQAGDCPTCGLPGFALHGVAQVWGGLARVSLNAFYVLDGVTWTTATVWPHVQHVFYLDDLSGIGQGGGSGFQAFNFTLTPTACP